MGKTVRSDAELVQQTLAGHRAAFDALIERHFGLVYVIALARLDDPERAEDLAQEVFLRSYVHLAHLNPPSKFPAWLSRIARNLAIDWLRRGQRASRLLPMIPMAALPGEIADPEAKGVRDTMVEIEESQMLQRALSTLPHGQREIVMLRFTEGLSQSEIAERLGMHQSTVSRVLKRALSSLRGQLEPILHGTAPTLRPALRATVKTVAAIAAFEAMAPAAKAALVAAAASGAGGSAAAAKASAALGSVSLLSSLSGWIAGGSKVMATAKGIAATVVTIGAVLAGAYHFKQSNDLGNAPVGSASSASTQAAEFTNSIGMRMISIPGGTFEMGSPPDEPGHLLTQERQHSATVEAFWMGATEVTVAQYQRFVEATGHREPTHWADQLQTPQHPVTYVSWNDANAFCEWLTDVDSGLYTLPTEAQWEFACRAGTTTAFAFGDTLSPDQANFDAQADREGSWEQAQRYLQDVGSHSPNAWGLFDMHGNVSEWCDGNARETGSRVQPMRGGSWIGRVRECRSASRLNGVPEAKGIGSGFRVARFDGE